MNTPSEDEVRLIVAKQAADWFVNNRSAVAEEQERVTFMNWLRTSPLHVEEYLRIAAISRDLQAVAADPQVSLEELLADAGDDPSLTDEADHAATVRDPAVRATRAIRSSWTPAWHLGVVATVLIVVLAGVVWHWDGAPKEAETAVRFATGHGEQRSWTLTDGSVVQLNTDSALRVAFDQKERFVELTQGQVYFSVAKDPQRRFRVIVNGAEIVAVGTQFDIYQHDQSVLVTVTEGRIAVYGGGEHASPQGMAASGRPVSVGAGEQIRINQAAVLESPTRAALKQNESWRSGRIVFEDQPLGQVVEQFNRYAKVPIEVSDLALGSVRIGGEFDAYDIDSFCAFLQSMDGVVVTRTAKRVDISRRPSPVQGRQKERQ
jgi:transmembrane sensor